MPAGPHANPLAVKQPCKLQGGLLQENIHHVPHTSATPTVPARTLLQTCPEDLPWTWMQGATMGTEPPLAQRAQGAGTLSSQTTLHASEHAACP